MNTVPEPQESTVRLAESDTVAVDLCPCGTIHLHLGGLSLRLRPEGAASLLQTLGIAFARRQAMITRASDTGELFAARFGGDRRKGEA